MEKMEKMEKIIRYRRRDCLLYEYVFPFMGEDIPEGVDVAESSEHFFQSQQAAFDAINKGRI